jgi:hypothetical protein
MKCVPPSDGYEQGDEWTRRFGKDPLLSLTTMVKVSEKELVLSYQVHNRSPRDAYLFTGVHGPRHTPYFDEDPDVIYVHLERNSKTVWLNKRIPAIPDDCRPYTPSYPEQTPLRAGATFREEVHVPLPLEEVRAYARSGQPGQPALATYECVRFTLQYYWRTEGMTEQTRMVPKTPFDLPPDAPRHVPVIVTRGGTPLTDTDHGFLESDCIPLKLPVWEIP